jgi:HAD superfamily hydrolase (TIGR01509 family)
MIRAIFFDLDDTLENWWIAKTAIKDKFCGFVAKKYGLNKEQFYKTFVEVEYEIVCRSLNPMVYDRKVWIKQALKRFRIEISKKELENLDKLYWKIAFSKIKAYPDTIPTLGKLGKYKKIMITDSDGDPKNQIKNKKIDKLKLRKYFDLIVTSNNTGKNKPDNGMWKLALKKLKLNPSECVMVGDKPEMDLKPTKAMGFTTVWIKRGDWASRRKAKKFKYVDYEITKISELLRIL